MAAMAAHAARAQQAPAHDDGLRDETWRDGARARELPVRIRQPRQRGPWPLIVYSHGLGGNRSGGDAWGQAWSAAGFMVLHVQHAGSDSALWRQGAAALRAAISAEQLHARAADIRFAIDEVTRLRQRGADGWGEVRLDAIGMAGHSFGARTAQALAGERFAVTTQWVEPRLRAFIALSPSSPPNMPPHQAFGEVTRPFLAITGSSDGDPFGAYGSGERRARIYQGLPAGQRALLWLDGADHSSFAGNAEQRITAPLGPLRREPVALAREAAHHALVARLSTLWWRWHLLGDAAAWASLKTAPGLTAGDRLELG
jgi:predicted dienelactone hydrolase